MTENPFLKRRNRNKIGKSGRSSEQKLTKKLGGRQTPGSGNQVGAKGDAKVGQFLIEMKSTVNDSFTLKREVLAKIAGEAMQQNKYPALTVSFVQGNGQPRSGDSEWVLVPLKQFNKFKEFIEAEDV